MMIEEIEPRSSKTPVRMARKPRYMGLREIAKAPSVIRKEES